MLLTFIGEWRVSHFLSNSDNIFKPLIIFDCDGVLVDSEPIAASVISSLLLKNGIDMDPEKCHAQFHGFTMESVVAWVREECKLRLGKKFLEQYNELLAIQMELELKPVQGITEILEILDNPTCVVSNGSLEKIRRSLKIANLEHFFCDQLFSSDHVKKGKPNPELFYYAAEKMGVEPSQTFVIEDSLIGVEGGMAAGMNVLAYVPGQNLDDQKYREKLESAGAKTFSKMADLPDMLKY